MFADFTVYAKFYRHSAGPRVDQKLVPSLETVLDLTE